jgi:hypothetical protein
VFLCVQHFETSAVAGYICTHTYLRPHTLVAHTLGLTPVAGQCPTSMLARSAARSAVAVAVAAAAAAVAAAAQTAAAAAARAAAVV